MNPFSEMTAQMAARARRNANNKWWAGIFTAILAAIVLEPLITAETAFDFVRLVLGLLLMGIVGVLMFMWRSERHFAKHMGLVSHLIKEDEQEKTEEDL